MIFYRPAERDRELLPHDPFKSLVAPRPIGWVSTMAADGSVNLAPYSFFNAIGEGPPMLAFSSNGARTPPRLPASCRNSSGIWSPSSCVKR